MIICECACGAGQRLFAAGPAGKIYSKYVHMCIEIGFLLHHVERSRDIALSSFRPTKGEWRNLEKTVKKFKTRWNISARGVFVYHETDKMMVFVIIYFLSVSYENLSASSKFLRGFLFV